MSSFDKFKKKHGPPSQCEKVSASSLKAYAGKLPGELLEEWKQTGWCAYGDGLLWTVNPEDFADILPDWIENAEGAYAFLRTGFGGIYYWNGSEANYVDVLFGGVWSLFDTMELNFNEMLCDDTYLDDVIRRQEFKEALPRLGAPARDECYAFVPAIALGGAVESENLERAKLREHLAILAQL
jgi:hypothetical protein